MRQAILGFVLLATATVPTTAQQQPSPMPGDRRSLATAMKGEERLRQEATVPLAVIRVRTGRPSQFARLAAAAPVITTTTPFVQHTRVRIASFSGRRIELGAFKSRQPLGNLLYGLPGGGSRPAWGLGSRVNSGALTPNGSESFGLQLTVALGPLSSDSERVDAWRCLARIVGMGGCRLN